MNRRAILVSALALSLGVSQSADSIINSGTITLKRAVASSRTIAVVRILSPEVRRNTQANGPMQSLRVQVVRVLKGSFAPRATIQVEMSSWLVWPIQTVGAFSDFAPLENYVVFLQDTVEEPYRPIPFIGGVFWVDAATAEARGRTPLADPEAELRFMASATMEFLSAARIRTDGDVAGYLESAPTP